MFSPKRLRYFLRHDARTVTSVLKNLRAPSRWHSWKRNWFTGCVVLTKQTFAAFALGKPIIYVPLEHERFSELRLTIVDGVLFVGFDAAAEAKKTNHHS
jgi:hypothetical protein